MTSEITKKIMDLNANPRNFIAENVTNIQKLQSQMKSIIRQKSEMEIKRSFGRRFTQKVDFVRSKSCPGYGHRIKKLKGQDKKRDKINDRRMHRAHSPEFHQSEEPQTFIETFKEGAIEEKIHTKNIPVKNSPLPPKVKTVNVRDFGCQYGDPKRTYFFEDGSNINVYIPSRERLFLIQEKETDFNKRAPFIVPSRYLLFKKKTYDEEMAKQIEKVKNLKTDRSNKQKEYREEKQREDKNQQLLHEKKISHKSQEYGFDQREEYYAYQKNRRQRRVAYA